MYLQLLECTMHTVKSLMNMCHRNDLPSIPKLLRQRRGKDEQNVRLAKDSLVEGTGWKYTTQQTVWDSIQGDLHTLWVGLPLVQPLWKTVQRFLKKLKAELSYDPTILLLGTHPRVHSSIIYNCRDMEATEVSINRGMDKMHMVHIHNGIPFGHRKE